MRDFVHLGFNEGPRGERVFDGILNWIGGASGGFFNYRFAQPTRTHRQHIGRWFPERQFPFANQVLHDPVTERTLVPALPRTVAGFPELPGVLYTGLMSTGDRFDYGASFDRGILTTLPPTIEGSPYPAFVPKTDADGNDVAGIRLPQIAVPLATYTGWGVRAAAFAGDDLCDQWGQQIGFARTKAERLASGDPRLSVEERYESHENYVQAIFRCSGSCSRRTSSGSSRRPRLVALIGKDIRKLSRDVAAHTVD